MRFRVSLKVAAIATVAGAAVVGPADAQYMQGATEYAPPPPQYVVPAEGTTPPGYGASVYAPTLVGPGPGYGAPPPAYGPPASYPTPLPGAGAPPPPAGPSGMLSPGQAQAIALNLGYDQVGRPVLQGSTYMMTANIDSGPVLLGVNAYTGRLRPLGPAYPPPGTYGPSYPPPSVPPAPQRSVSRPPPSVPLPTPRPPDANMIDSDGVPDTADDVSAPPPPGAVVGSPDIPPPAQQPAPAMPMAPTGAGAVTPGDNVSGGSASVISRGAQ